VQALASDLREGRIRKGSAAAEDALEALRLAVLDQSGDGQVALAAISALGESSGRADLALLLAQTLPGRPGAVRKAALAALKQMRVPGAAGRFIALAKEDADVSVRIAALDALGDVLDPALLVRLAELAARGEPPAVASAARHKLASVRTPQHIGAFSLTAQATNVTRALAKTLQATSEYGRRLEEVEGQVTPPAEPPPSPPPPPPVGGAGWSGADHHVESK
jgi:HEAT repeat protein